MAGIGLNAHQHRHQFVIPADQLVIGVDIDDIDPAARRQFLERIEHVITQMTVGPRIQNEVRQGDFLKPEFGNENRRSRPSRHTTPGSELPLNRQA